MNIGLLFDIFEKAREGDATSQCRLGKCFYQGKSVNVNYHNAIDWFSKAAEQGDIESLFYLGLCYYFGNGYNKDYVKAIDCFNKVAKEDHDRANKGVNWDAQFAQLFLFYIYRDGGYGVEQDLQKAAYWLKRAAEQGDTCRSKSLLSSYYYDDDGLGEIVKDNENALLWAVKAIDTTDFEDDSEKAQRIYIYLLIGCDYRLGINLKKDWTKAVYWYTKAAEEGSIGAQTSLSELYFEGDGNRKNFEKAEYWLLKAIESGYDDEDEMLEKIYEAVGVEHECYDNINWIINLAERGIVGAQYELGRHYSCFGNYNYQQQSIYWFTKAAEQGHEESQYTLAQSYEGGYGGCEQDSEKAIYWYTKAAEQGRYKAQEKLADYYFNLHDYKTAEHWYLECGLDNSFYNKMEKIEINKDNISWFIESGEEGNVESQLKLADYYSRNSADIENEIYWYSKAGKDNDATPKTKECSTKKTEIKKATKTDSISTGKENLIQAPPMNKNRSKILSANDVFLPEDITSYINRNIEKNWTGLSARWAYNVGYGEDSIKRQRDYDRLVEAAPVLIEKYKEQGWNLSMDWSISGSMRFKITKIEMDWSMVGFEITKID